MSLRLNFLSDHFPNLSTWKTYINTLDIRQTSYKYISCTKTGLPNVALLKIWGRGGEREEGGAGGEEERSSWLTS